MSPQSLADFALLGIGGIVGFIVAILLGWILDWREKRRQLAFERFAALEDYRAESNAQNGDLIHFQCPRGHTDSRQLEQFGELPSCTQCGGLMEPVSFTPVVK